MGPPCGSGLLRYARNDVRRRSAGNRHSPLTPSAQAAQHQSVPQNSSRHCERSEAIQCRRPSSQARLCSGLLRYARNDAAGEAPETVIPRSPLPLRRRDARASRGIAPVIASGAKQSSAMSALSHWLAQRRAIVITRTEAVNDRGCQAALDCFAPLAMTALRERARRRDPAMSDLSPRSARASLSAIPL